MVVDVDAADLAIVVDVAASVAVAVDEVDLVIVDVDVALPEEVVAAAPTAVASATSAVGRQPSKRHTDGGQRVSGSTSAYEELMWHSGLYDIQ